MNKKEKDALRKDIRKVIINSFNEKIETKNQMRFFVLEDLGLTELEILRVVDEVEDSLGTNIDDSLILDDISEITLFDLVSHYNEVFLKSCIKERTI